MTSYLVVMSSDQAPAYEPFVDALTQAGVYRGDTIRAHKRLRGIAFRNASEERATDIATALTGSGIEAMAVPEGDYPKAPRPQKVSRVQINDEVLHFPGLSVLGHDAFLDVREVTLVLAALHLPAEDQSLSQIEEQLGKGELEREDSLALAVKMREQAASAGFPLAEYLSADPSTQVNFSRMSGEKKMSKREKKWNRFVAQKAQDRFISDHPGLEGYLYIGTASRVVKIAGHDVAISYSGEDALPGHWLKSFHRAVQSLVYSALSAWIPPSTKAFADAKDDNVYLYQDTLAIEEHLRWGWAEQVMSRI